MQYLESQRQKKAIYLFESNRLKPYSTRRIRQIVKQYANKANIQKRVYPHLFRHQLITLKKPSNFDVAPEYEQAMKDFPIQ
ncbi:MAG: tyrosine-type recombinase/integrase [Planctomycetota bacterium]